MLPAVAAILACGSASSERPPYADSKVSNRTIAIEGVAIIDVERGEIVTPRTVLVDDGRIAAIDELDTMSIPPAPLRVDGHGRYLMPGLVDMHVHLFNNATNRPPNDWAFPLFVASGVTAVREMAAKPSDIATVNAWRAGVTRRDLIAPHVLAAGIATRCDSDSAVMRQAREARKAGADFLKVFSNAQERHWRRLLNEALALKMPVSGHIPAAVSALDAAASTHRSNEHLMQIFEVCSAREEEFLRARRKRDGNKAVELRDTQEPEVLDSFDPEVCARAAAALAKTKQVQVPTLVLSHFEARASPQRPSADARWRHLRADEQERWNRILDQEPAGDQRLAKRRCDVSREIVRALHRAGVRILAGTDAPMPRVYPGFALHKELELLVEAGLSAADALRAATIWPAEFLGIADISGSIAVGKRADLVLLDDNPLREISNTQRIRTVVLDGRLLHRADVDALLSGAADVHE